MTALIRDIKAWEGDFVGIVSFGATIIRLIMSIVASMLIVLAAQGFQHLATGIIILIIAVDYYDGILFRKSVMNNVKSWRIRRRLFDSMSDRLIIQIGCLSVLFTDPHFAPIYIVITVRELVFTGYWNWAFHFRKTLIEPKGIAKAAAASIGLIVIAYLETSTRIAGIATLLMIAMSFLSFRNYVTRFNSRGRHDDSDILEI